MKIIKTIAYIVLALVLVLVLLGFMGPKGYDVSRTVSINAPTVVVFPYLKSIKKQNEWGPWKEEDPDMKVTYEGEDGTVGFKSMWEGEKSGKGEQRIASIMGTTIETELTFFMPWGTSKSTGYLHASDASGGSEVTWGIRGENDFISRIFSVFMNMDKAVGPMFDKGLQSLKQMIEGDISKEYKGYKIQIVDFRTKEFAAIRGNVAMKDVSDFFGNQMAALSAALGKANVQMIGAPCGLYYTWDTDTQSTEMAVAAPVQPGTSVADTEPIVISEGKALLIDYMGPYDKMTDAHDAMDEFMKTTGVKMRPPVIEEYMTDPQAEPDQSKWLTKIYYLLVQ